jgi:lipoprotein-anchoring transpeptidase ErfK/SrfK
MHRGAAHPGHRTVATASHRAVRPRLGRLLAVATAAGVTAVAVLSALGVFGVAHPAAPAAAGTADQAPELELSGFFEPASVATPGVDAPVRGQDPSTPGRPPEVPAGSGTGKRVVFAIGAQRVWLVGPGDQVVRTYLVSGSVTDNLRPGEYEVYSTSRNAVGVDDSGTMKFMVRFAHGEHAAIGFHDIPVHDGELVQGVSDLGTPQSHGCVRQWRPDARALWRFAPVGTTVVVTA